MIIRENGDGVASTLVDVISKTKELHEKVKERGGYGELVKQGVEKASQEVDRFYDAVYGPINDTFFTDNEFDKEKTDEFLRDKEEAIRRFGRKTIDTITNMASSGVDAIKKDYRDNVPTREELETAYSGIGSDYNGVLLKPDLDRCIKYHGKAKSKIPSRAKFRGEILDDIKASASATKKDITSFYKISSEDNASNKLKAVQKYL